MECEILVDEHQRDLAVILNEPRANLHAESDVHVAETDDRDALLRELYHRTQNTLQVLASLMRLRAATPEAEALAIEMERRINVISSVQRGRYDARDLNRIDLARVASRIAETLMTQLVGGSGRISLRLPEGCCMVGIDLAMPAAMALYEALSNALFHAFPDGRRGNIEIRLREIQGGMIELSVIDDGVGLPPDYDNRRSYNAGMFFLRCNTDQLGGSLSLERRDPGLAVLILFNRQFKTTPV